MAQIIKTNQVKNPCIICNGMPMDETSEVKKPLPFFHAVGVDVNWNEDCNICQNCARVMAEMLGYVEPEKVARAQKRLDDLRTKHAELQEEHSEQSARIKRILEGRKAEKTQKEKVRA